MPHVSAGRSAARALLLATLITSGLATTASAAPAVGELVSRADGPSGASLGYSRLADASSDGRFVAFEATIGSSNQTFYLRDRQLGKTTKVLVDDAGEPISTAGAKFYNVRDVSDDGRYVLIAQPTYGAGPEELFVRDVAAGTNIPLNRTAEGTPLPKVAGYARFLDGGPAVLYGAADADDHWNVYRRETPTAAPVIAAPGVKLAQATRNGNVITWTRTLPVAVRPAGNHGPVSSRWPNRTGEASGYTIAGQGPKLAARTKYVETTSAPAQFCIDGGVTAVRTTYSAPGIDDYGHQLRIGSSVFDERFPSSDHRDRSRTFDVSEDGQRAMGGTEYYTGPPGNTFGINPPSGTPGLPELPELPLLDPYSTGSTEAAQFYAHDTGILRQETNYQDDAKTGIYAYDPVDEGAAPEAKTPADLPGATADDPSSTADVAWAECAPVAPPTELAPFIAYANVTLAKPATISKPAGSVTVRLKPSPAHRALTSVSIKVQAFGFTTWSRTIRADEDVKLPKPYWLIPQTVVVSFGVAADPATGAPAATRQQSASWQALR